MTMHNTQFNRRRRRLESRIGLAVVAIFLAFTGSAPASAEIPHYTWCQYAFPGDAGGIISPYDTPSAEFTAALRGEISAGTDCSLYHLVT